MSDQFDHTEVAIKALKKEVFQLQEEARREEQHLRETCEKVIEHHLQTNQQMLMHVENIELLRREVLGLTEQLKTVKGFDEEDLDNIQVLGEQLVNAPLFHPQYEKMLAQQAAARQNGHPFDAQLRQQMEERLEDFNILPGEIEIKAGEAILKAFQEQGTPKQGLDIELATEGLLRLASLALQQSLADNLATEKAAGFLNDLKAGLKACTARLQNEHRQVSNSSFGRRALQSEPQENLEDMKGLQDMLAKLKTAFEDTIRLSAPSPLLEEVAEQFGLEDDEEYRQALVDAFLEDMLDESEGLMFSEDFDADSDGLFQDNEEWEDENWAPAENPRFPIGSSVAVITSAKPFKGFSKLDIQGWQGRVVDAYTNGTVIAYEVVLDSVTLQGLPEKFIRRACEEDYGSFFRYEFEETDLRPAEARDTEAEALASQRRLFHRYFWGEISQDAQAARVFEIMMKEPAAEDIDNWINYFRKEVEFPFNAQVEGLILRKIEPGTVVEVLGIEGLDEEEDFGLIASIRKGRAILSFPLMELMPVNDKDPKAQALLDYRLWADLML
ncbi:MAG: hypothetical protein H6566_02550 [Lewinellaceae bacterium]|nr:hypothetical protein [Lewinellaceae bacterium]